MENGLTFLFKSDDLRALLNAPSTYVYVTASLKTGTIGGKHVAVMQVQADAYLEGIPPLGESQLVKVSASATGCPVPPCKDPEGRITMDCIDESASLLNSYKTTDFKNGFNLQ